ncbi:MAG: FAD-dependent oxidoreductase, partial [Clostridia bacterium]|nr:FAD-dependent oxidoreductase [Clostridia bacterium]
MRNKPVSQFDIVIIGGGPAGLAAGIWSGRGRFKTLVIEQALLGGLAVTTSIIDNYPGFPEGVTGKGLIELFYLQAKKYSVQFKLTNVKNIDLLDHIKKIETFKNIYEAKVVIIATGKRPKTTGAMNEDKYIGKGISFCSACDAASNTCKKVVVVGSNDEALEESVFLAKFADEVTVTMNNDMEHMECKPYVKLLALNNPKIHFKSNTMVEAFEGNEKLEKVILKDIKTHDMVAVPCHSCFEYIGYLPNTDLFKGLVNLDDEGYIIT